MLITRYYYRNVKYIAKMPNAYCVLCGNRDKLVSYYTFPKNKEFRKKWLSFCGINKKVLNTTTKLCSNHFQKEDIINKTKGSIIKPNAVPCIIIKKKRLHIENVPLSENYTTINFPPSSYERTAKTETVAEESRTNQIATDEIIVETEKVTEEIRTNQIATNEIENMYFNNASYKGKISTSIKTIRVPRYVGDIQMSHIYTPRRAKRALDIAKKTIQNQQKKIKALKQSQKRLVTRLKTMEGLIGHLKQKDLLSEATAENLMQTKCRMYLLLIKIYIRKSENNE
ncbi:uncharacterized protein [Linepithema humile]|uniref:uncharacterized protein n=1 Tax=Linepithema humile TaxID=83485 RepID=UPI00351E4CEF